MPIDAEIARVGASRLSESGLPVVTATNPLGSGENDVEHFGEIDAFGVLGVTARPAAANTNGHAEALVFRGVPGTTGITGLVRDERAADAYAMLNEGDSCLHATGTKHGAMLLTREDGRVTMLTSEDATTTGRTVFAECAPDAHRWVAPWGKVTFGGDGFHVRHHTGARIDLNGVGGLPAPLDAMSSMAAISAHAITLKGLIIQLGQGGVPDAVAKSTALVAALGSLATALTSIAATLQTIAAGTTSPAGPSAAAGVTSGLIASAVSALGTAVIATPSASTTVT